MCVCVCVFFTDVWAFNLSISSSRDCLTLEDGADRMSENVGNRLPFYAT